MRHPGMQFQNRMRELADVFTSRINALSESCGRIKMLEDDLYTVRKERDKQILELNEAEDIQRLLIKSYVVGLYPWGLPDTISPKEWERLTGSSAFNISDQAGYEASMARKNNVKI